MHYRKRNIETSFNELFKVFTAISVTGPRQSGKSTLIKHFIDDSWKYYSLDDQSLLLRIKDDPEQFVKSINTNIVIDEAQKAPALFHSLKQLIDSKPSVKIIMSGSANFLLMKSITESLAGRVGLLELLPFSLAEATECKAGNILEQIVTAKDTDDLCSRISCLQDTGINDFNNFVLHGGYPKIHNLKSEKSKQLWLKNYINTYLERDVRDLAQVGDMDTFQRIYRIAAHQTGNVLNMSSFAADVGITVQTVKKYLSIMQTSFQCGMLPSYHFNQTKQITKAPKIFYYDTGLVNFITHNSSIDQLQDSGKWGASIETFVFSQLHKSAKLMDHIPSLYYWRTNNKAEVDFIIESTDSLIPIEVKAGTKIQKQSIMGLKSFKNSQKNKHIPFSIVLYGGEEVYFIDKETLAVPLRKLV